MKAGAMTPAFIHSSRRFLVNARPMAPAPNSRASGTSHTSGYLYGPPSGPTNAAGAVGAAAAGAPASVAGAAAAGESDNGAVGANVMPDRSLAGAGGATRSGSVKTS